MWIMLKRRKQNHKISFHFFSGSPHTPRRKWIGKEIFGFVHATAGSVRGAQYSLHHAIGAYDLGKSYHALGACVSHQNPADFAHTMFELRPKNTANFHFRPKRRERACREATRNAIFALRAKVFSGTRKGRGRAGAGSFEQSPKSRSGGTTNLFVRSVERCKAIFNFDCPKVNFAICV